MDGGSNMSTEKPHDWYGTREQLIDRVHALEDSDAWMAHATKALQSGTCPVCFATDEAGHTESCEWGRDERALRMIHEALSITMMPTANSAVAMIRALRTERDLLHDFCGGVAENAVEIDGRWVIAKPVTAPLWRRIRNAWDVLRGRAEVVRFWRQ
jgi:hypothetical protein